MGGSWGAAPKGSGAAGLAFCSRANQGGRRASLSAAECARASSKEEGLPAARVADWPTLPACPRCATALVPLSPSYFLAEVLPVRVPLCVDPTLETRHGSVAALAELVPALKCVRPTICSFSFSRLGSDDGMGVSPGRPAAPPGRPD